MGSHSPFSNTTHKSHHEVLCSALRHPGRRLRPVPHPRHPRRPWLRPGCLRSLLPFLCCCPCSLPRCCPSCCGFPCCPCCPCCSCCSCCPCCSRSHRPRGDQQPVQGRGRGGQHCVRLPEHQQRRRAARHCQRQRRHRQLLLRGRGGPPQRVLHCRRPWLPCDRPHQEVRPGCPCCLRWSPPRWCRRSCRLRRRCPRCRCRCRTCRPCSGGRPHHHQAQPRPRRLLQGGLDQTKNFLLNMHC